VIGTHLEHDVDEGAGLEVLAAKPLVEHVEDRQQLLLRSGAAALRPRLDEPPGPELLPALEKGEDQIVLGGKVPIERRLGDPGVLDQLVDPHRADTALREQLIGAVEDALASLRLSIAGLLALTCAGNSHLHPKLPLRQVCLSMHSEGA
jgi:hypothetical protein